MIFFCAWSSAIYRSWSSAAHSITHGLTASRRITGAGVISAVEHLISLGHKRIGFIGVSPINGAGLRRYQGYLDALRDNRLVIDEKLIVGPSAQSGPGYSTQDDGYTGMQKLLALKKPPTAVFARNDFTAIGAICAIRDARRQIPDDIAVVGFDDVSLAAYSTPPLTTVRQPTREQGREAARLLLERIEGGKELERREICLDCQLVVRQSTVARETNSGPDNATIS